MATKNANLHNQTVQDIADAQQYLADKGTLEGWTGKTNTGKGWMDIWSKRGVDVTKPEAMANQLAISEAQYAKGPKAEKWGKLTSAKGAQRFLRKVALPAASFVVPFAGSGGMLGSLGTKVAGLAGKMGPLGGLLTGSFSKNPLTNALIGQGIGMLGGSLGIGTNTLGSQLTANSLGNQLHSMTAPKVKTMTGTPGKTQWEQMGKHPGLQEDFAKFGGGLQTALTGTATGTGMTDNNPMIGQFGDLLSSPDNVVKAITEGVNIPKKYNYTKKPNSLEDKIKDALGLDKDASIGGKELGSVGPLAGAAGIGMLMELIKGMKGDDKPTTPMPTMPLPTTPPPSGGQPGTGGDGLPNYGGIYGLPSQPASQDYLMNREKYKPQSLGRRLY